VSVVDFDLSKLFSLEGRVALVTGGSRGLGLQIAAGLAEFGATTILVARKRDELEIAAEALKGAGGRAFVETCDFSVPDQIAALVARMLAAHARIDILVNNAGATWGAAAEDVPLDAWNKLVAVNLTGPFLLTQAIAKRSMIPNGRGRILNIASIEGLKGHHPSMLGTLPYNTTKGGLINFTRALAAEWARHGVTVNALAPGYFPSKMTRATLDAHETLLVANTPRGELGGPSDIKGAALLLVSEAGAHITGQILVVDGGASVI
jgi:gluconate 5-dehydrogenase